MAVAVIWLTFWLRLTNLEALGLGSLNYAATVQSMLMSGYNFFFLAAEPGGSITIDKPPLALWIQGLSAAVFGFRALALFYPQIVSGLLSTALLYRLVGSTFGRPTGLLAALILATTPINVAVERTNQVDAVLILLLLLAAGAFLRAARIGSRRWLLAGGMLVGLAFNTKMLQALIPLPALLTMYALEPRRGWRHKIKALIGCVAVMAAVGLSWIAAVDLTPPDQRPHVGGSSTNSALNLALGYNGATRLFGSAIPHPPTAWIAGQGFIEPPRSGVELLAAPNPETGLPGPLRLFTGPLNNDIGWLLPLGVLGLVMLIDLARRTRSADAQRQLALWGGWLVVGGTVFSAAGFIHTHYVATLSPAFAALAAIALRQLWRLYHTRPYAGLAALAGVTSGLVIWQIGIARQYVWDASWIPIVAIPLLALGLIGLVVSAAGNRKLTPIAFVSAAASVLATSLVWAVLTAFDESPFGPLPRAYAGETCWRDVCTPPGQFRRGGSAREVVSSVRLGEPTFDPALLAYLQSNTQDIEYLLAITDARTGAEYVIAAGRPVLYVRGFFGLDHVADQYDLARMVEEGRLRFVLWPEVAPPGAPPDPILNWLQAACQRVEDVALPRLNNPPFQRGLYRCDPAG